MGVRRLYEGEVLAFIPRGLPLPCPRENSHEEEHHPMIPPHVSSGRLRVSRTVTKHDRYLILSYRDKKRLAPPLYCAVRAERIEEENPNVARIPHV